MVREVFVTELVKEVLGPRNGLNETMSDSPLTEYITGVLAPISQHLPRDIEGEGEIPYADSQVYEDETGDVEVQAPPLLSPALDPKSRAPSMGIAFVVNPNGSNPLLKICMTWARYLHMSNSKNWRRAAKNHTMQVSPSTNLDVGLDSNGHRVAPNAQSAEASFHVRSRRHNGQFHLTLHFVNRISFVPQQPQDMPRTEHHIFQPQIRVKAGEGCEIIPGFERKSERQEEKELAFLYRDRPVYARGYLVSAIWNKIDPERPFNGHLDFATCANEPPFHWTDGTLLPQTDRDTFTAPDVRTEFVPIYPIPSPELGWPEEFDVRPELAAGSLAELWSPSDIRRSLEPITTGYRSWIDTMNSSIASLSLEQQAIANRMLEECKNVVTRMESGITLLCNDEEIRLSFCFANKVLDMQYSRWGRNAGLTWRPFQVAFILMIIESIVNPRSSDRDVCDLLWVPTGAGKTEAYLATAIFAMAYRRRRSLTRQQGDRTGAGVCVITRYTLRLLTIQQFRRTLAAITAADFLRVDKVQNRSLTGWRPGASNLSADYLWGSTQFSIGLWVGQDVTPNHLRNIGWGTKLQPGALSILQGVFGQGEPAQVLNCPACDRILAIPEMGLLPGRPHEIHMIVQAAGMALNQVQALASGLQATYGDITVMNATFSDLPRAGYFTLSLTITMRGRVRASAFNLFWRSLEQRLPTITRVAASAARPGYFLRWYSGSRGRGMPYDFEIFCPNPNCSLRIPWRAGSPAGSIHGRPPFLGNGNAFQDGNAIVYSQEAFETADGTYDRVPIPALTVDDQIYHRVPSMIVSTVDKFARPSWEPRASAIFGNVQFHSCIGGYYRLGQHHDLDDNSGHAKPTGPVRSRNYLQTQPLDSPDLVMQDELHLIEGPLGSMVGVYEAATEFLCQEFSNPRVKYIASTATVHRAQEQVRAIFTRRLQKFPPYGTSAADRFFVRDFESHPLDDRPPGRLYIGICATGRGPLTPVRNIWARLLQIGWDNRTRQDIDRFWTLTGYFNAIRELAGARALYRQDIHQRLDHLAGPNARPIPDDRCQELSSVMDSTDLPAVLNLLNATYDPTPPNNAQDSLFTTSMFGTGVDIPRIGLMFVNGQPKTTSAYIQSTGRVGRRNGALVVTFFRASRPRDLNHYEFFCRYHSQLHRFVEPITVYPFAPGVIELCAGPVAVFYLRNARNTPNAWSRNESAPLMASQSSSQEVQMFLQNMNLRARASLSAGLRQTPEAQAQIADVNRRITARIHLWRQVASLNQAQVQRNQSKSIVFREYAIDKDPTAPVVLGDSQHQHAGFDVVYENAPQSLREIEETTGFET